MLFSSFDICRDSVELGICKGLPHALSRLFSQSPQTARCH